MEYLGIDITYLITTGVFSFLLIMIYITIINSIKDTIVITSDSKKTIEEFNKFEKYIRKFVFVIWFLIVVITFIFFGTKSNRPHSNIGSENIKNEIHEFVPPSPEEINNHNSEVLKEKEILRERSIEKEQEKAREEYKKFIDESLRNLN